MGFVLEQGSGASRGGVHDTFGEPLRFIIAAGQTGAVPTAPALPDGLSAEAVFADKAYGSNASRCRTNKSRRSGRCVPDTLFADRSIVPEDAEIMPFVKL